MPFCRGVALNTVRRMSPSNSLSHDGTPPGRPCPPDPHSPRTRARTRRRLFTLRRSEAGLVSVEYLVTAVLAGVLIAVLAAVPLASSPTVAQNFEAAVCNIFGGGCEGGDGGEQTPEETTPEIVDPNDEVPTCMVSREEEAGSGSAEAGIVEIGGGWKLRQDTNSDGSISLTLISAYDGSVGPKIPGAESGNMELKGDVEVSIGYEQGDTWRVDNQEEADRLRQELEDWTMYNMLNDGSIVNWGDLFAGVSGGPEPPRDPDTKRYTVELGAGAELKGNLGFDIDEVLEGSLGLNLGADVSGQVGVEVAADGTITLILQRKVTAEAGINGEINAGVEADAGASGSAGLTELIRIELDENFEPQGMSIRQIADLGYDLEAELGLDLSEGDDGTHKDDEATIGESMGENQQYWWDMNIDFSQIPPEQRDEAMAQYFLDPRPTLIPDLMYRGPQPYHSGSSEFFFEHAQLQQNIYSIDEWSAEEGFNVAGFGVSWDSTTAAYELVESEYALPIENGNRDIAINTDCVG